jgi:hypothetical protein
MRQLNYHHRHHLQRIMISICRTRFFSCSVVAVAVAISFAGCRRKETQTPPVATASVHLNHDKAPLGSPLDITYKFVVASDAHFDEDYHVMLHVVDADDELMWTDDHTPPTPTTRWKPGQTIEYTRTVFVPIYPYVGEATLQLGLYSTATQKRLPLNGDDAGQRAYRAGKLQLQPQSENIVTIFKDGWHPAEVADHNASVQWQWTKKEATLAFKNPRKDSTFFLDLDNPGGLFKETQHVTVTLGGAVVDQFDLMPAAPQLRRVALKADQLGTGDMDEIQIAVDKTFVPMQLSAGASKDPRELGVRVFHAFIEPVG